MKKLVVVFVLLLSLSLFAANETYILVGWNDLGMHCANKDFQNMAILPPYNNLMAQIIQTGGDGGWPQLVGGDFKITYEIPGNTYSVGKTNFWSFEDKLFGVQLDDNIGLTGNGLVGEFELIGDYFEATGIPVTPYTDADLINESPYQLATLKLYDSNDTLLDTTQVVIPVSNEISCVSSGCHSSEADILEEHEGKDDGGFDPSEKPILCASCHSSNALGMAGRPGLESLSEVIHDEHKDKTNDCYKCHPGSQAQCFRGVMSTKGMVCQDCHGTMRQFAESLKNGREPWLEEPQCGSAACHGANYAENANNLFRQSRGHGNLYCSACHGSPHAILASTEANDNVQVVDIQGSTGTLAKCSVCHGFSPGGAGPHNITTPVEIIAFSAHVIDNSVELTWKCEYISDIFRIQIQRSTNNDDYEVIATLAVDNNMHQTFRYTDENVPHNGSIFYRLKMISLDGSSEYSQAYQVHLQAPNQIRLYNNFPNPFNNSTRIRFDLPSDMNTVITITDLKGNLVNTLYEELAVSGTHELVWDGLTDRGRTVSSGIYFVSLKTKSYSAIQKINLIK